MPQKLSDKLQGYDGANPFHDSQFRSYGASKSLREFYPTSLFWSLFNEENEVLVGTRGSGKTAVLRMLTYTNLKKMDHHQAKQYVEARSFIGFYVPMNLEFMGALPGQEVPLNEKSLFFQAAFNCAAMQAFLKELSEVVADAYPDRKRRAEVELAVSAYLSDCWGHGSSPHASSFADIEKILRTCFNSLFSHADARKTPSFTFLSNPILLPIKLALGGLGGVLEIDLSETHWLVCIDEAEFLDRECLKCINTFMRAEERPLVIKMATLPFRHDTLETNQPGTFVEAHGSDFNYRPLDLDPESNDFVNLTNHVCRSRLRRCRIDVPNISLEDFLGIVGQEDGLLDYFRAEMGEEDSTETAVMAGIRLSVSGRRRQRIDALSEEPQKLKQPFFKKFSPVYYVRRMREENSKGHRTPGWFAGAGTLRKVADGNPRRFIQLMNCLVDAATKSELTPRAQHRAVLAFCDDMHEATAGYPEFGLVLKGLVDSIGQVLHAKVHGSAMKDAGCNFSVNDRFLASSVFRKALELGVAYCFIKTDERSFLGQVSEGSYLRLAFLFGVHFWLPLRDGGSAPRLRPKRELLDVDQHMANAPINRETADRVLTQLELHFDEEISQ